MKSLLNFRLAVFLSIGLIAGISFSYCVISENVFAAITVIVIFIAAFIIFTFFSTARLKNAGKVLCFLVISVCFAVGGQGLYFTVNNYKNADLDGHVLTATGRIEEITDHGDYCSIIVGDLTFSGIANGKSPYKIAVYSYGENDLVLGDVVRFKTTVKDRTVFYNGRFSAAAISQGITYYAEISMADITKISSVPNLFQRCNLFIKSVLSSGLDKDEFAIAYAMLTGNSDYIAEEDAVAFRAAGVAHIFAVSGLHIGLLATALFFVLTKIKIKKYIAFPITFLLCLFYAGVCGFSASSVRAVIMLFFLNFGKLAGLKYDSLSALFAAAFLILVASPAQLFCAGFLLSFSVVFTVIVLFNTLMRLLKFLPKKIAAPLATSVAAEIGSAPVLLYFFGSFPLIGLFVNLLFIPISGVIFIALVVGTLLGGFLPPTICLFLQNYAIFGINYIITTFNFKLFLIGGFTLWGFAISYYATVVISGGYLNLKRVAKTTLCIVLSLLTVVGTFVVNAARTDRTNAYVLGSENISAVLFSYSDQNLLVISDVSYKNFSEHRLIGVLSAAESGTLTVILLAQDTIVDFASITAKLRYAAKNAGLNFDMLYYCGERDIIAEKVVSETFRNFTLINVGDGTSFFRSDGEIDFLLDGRCLIFTRKGYNIGVFSSVYNSDLTGVYDVRFNTIFCVDNIDALTMRTKSEQAVSFRIKSGYPDGEKAGYLTLMFG